MFKKLILPAALLAVMGAAQAEVSIYGLIDVSYGKMVSEDASAATFHSGGDNGSSQGNSATKLGLKGSTEVATGIKANFQLETAGIDSKGNVGVPATITTAATPFFNRAAWVGLSGNLGEVRLGRQDNVMFQTLIGYDFNGAANMASAQGNSGATTWGGARQSRSLQYISPVVNGFKAQVGFQPKDGDLTATAENNKANYSLGLTYVVGAFSASVAAESARFETAGIQTATNSHSAFAASYDFKIVKAMVGYNNADNGHGATVGLVAPVAGYNVGMNYSKNTDSAATAAAELFVNREIFKNTYGYIDFANVQTNVSGAASTNNNGYAVGVIYTF